MSFALLYITHESEAEARRISDLLIEQKLIACANLFPINSIYWWGGEVVKEGEWVSLVKTTLEKSKTVEAAVLAIHTYQTPCIMKMEVTANASYEAWIEDMVKTI